MMSLFAVPMMLGLGTYFVPLMVGPRNLAFPRLNAFSYYVYLIGGLFLYTAFFLNTGPDAGWFAYAGEVMQRFEPVVLEQKPDCVIVYGDVNSTVAAGLVRRSCLSPSRMWRPGCGPAIARCRRRSIG